MRINPPTLFWILVSAILAADRFLPLKRFEEYCRNVGRWLEQCRRAA